MGGGGGTQGEVSFPDWVDAWMEDITDTNNEYLSRELGQVLRGASNSPYTGANAPKYADPFLYFNIAKVDDPGSYWDNTLKAEGGKDPSTAVVQRHDQGDNRADEYLDYLADIGFYTYDAEGDASVVVREGAEEADKHLETDIEADWESYIKQAANEADIRLEDIDVSSLSQAARSGSVDQIKKIINEADPGIDHEDVGKGIIEQAVQLTDAAGNIEDINWQKVFNAAKSAATDEVSAAVSKAQSVVNSQPVQDVVDDYRRRIEGEYEDRVNAFSAAMADINAINGSAYAIGLSLIRAEHQQDVAQFDSQLSLQLFQQALELHQSTLQSAMQNKLQAEVTNKQSREQFIQTFSQVIGNVYSQTVQLRSILSRLQQQAHGQVLQAESSAASQEKEARDQLIQQGAQAMVQLHQLRQDMRKSLVQMFQDYVKHHVTSQHEGNRLKLQKGRFAKQFAHQAYQSYWQQVMSEKTNLFQQLFQGASAYVEANNVYTGSELKREAKGQKWEMDRYEQATNIVSAPAAGGRTLPEGDSKAAGAVGGALSGAAAGSAVPGVGTAVGAGVGAALGGVSGYLGS